MSLWWQAMLEVATLYTQQNDCVTCHKVLWGHQDVGMDLPEEKKYKHTWIPPLT